MNALPPMPRSLPRAMRNRGVTAVLGPTNTGKTHYALERMTAHASGLIGLPLRLLAREVYHRLTERVGEHAVALVTGEEKIKPKHPRYWVSTVEAMPRDLAVDFVAVDEVQLAADPDRGHVFTDRVLNQRGVQETLLIGAGTARPLLEQLMPGLHVVTRPRLSSLSFSGEKKLTRLPPRSAIVAFSADEVYAVAELIRRQKGGAAVVLGSLSPRTRNAQVELFQSGDVDYLIATDAIGMGLNLDVDHVAFASDRKFDGHRFRRLHPAEFGQIAGRAGRHMRDGQFGSSGRCPAFEPELIEAIENHQFDAVRQFHWRNPDLDFRSIAVLKEALAEQPDEPGLTRAPAADDVTALEIVSGQDEIRRFARSGEAVERLWEACQLPDYRKVAASVHADLVATLYRFLMEKRFVPTDWFRAQVEALDRTDGDIDTLSNRIAQIRTWTFVANRPDWLADPKHWQGRTRRVEDTLSDALHERLAARFVDRRTSVLMRRLRENAMLEAEVTATGDVLVEGQHVGTLSGFVFLPDAQANGPEAKALNLAAQKALASEIEARAARLSLAADEAIVLAQDGMLRWQGEPVGRLGPGDKVLAPKIRIIADDTLPAPAREAIEARLSLWLKAHITRHLGPLLVLEDAPDLTGIARGVGFQIAEALGVLDRAKVADSVKQLDQEARAALRKHGVRFGAYHLYLPALLKPAPRALAAQLWALVNGGLDQKGRDEIAQLAFSGRTSIPADKEAHRDLYRAAGFRVAGERAIRVDILERLADLIRPAIAYRPGVTVGEPPAGAADGDGFVVTNAMTSLVGAAGPDFAQVLRALGYTAQTRKGPAITVPIVMPAPTQPVAAAEAESPSTVGGTEADAGMATGMPPGVEPVTADAVDASAAALPAPETSTPETSTPEISAEETVAPEASSPDDAATVETADEATDLSADTATEADPAAPAATAEPVAEPETAEIEIWRPARRDHQHHRRGQQRGQERAGEQRGRARGGAPRGMPRPEGTAAEAATPAGDGPGQRPGRDRSERRRDGDERGQDRRFQRRDDANRTAAPRDEAERRGGRDSRPDGRRPDRAKDERRGDNRGDNRHGDGRRGGERPPQRFEAKAPKQERPLDPDSPFAKLAALKAQMDAARKG